jgi:hypothetical protein
LRRHALALLLAVVVLALFFANVEIQIEGPNGWAAALPVTFRVEKHWLLDLFWGGRPLTGYHAWVFSFMALFFHFPMVWAWEWSPRLQLRALGCIALFWIVEDAAWFVLNPAFGWSRLTPAHVPWHEHWFAGLPTDYWTFTAAGLALFVGSFVRSSRGDARR